MTGEARTPNAIYCSLDDFLKVKEKTSGGYQCDFSLVKCNQLKGKQTVQSGLTFLGVKLLSEFVGKISLVCL